ncbi:MAG: hypothetical protein MZW92_23000 [Comamonadaceae bacterium]|nr:hypothetical protein [Comamonadaceae bacterium]
MRAVGCSAGARCCALTARCARSTPRAGRAHRRRRQRRARSRRINAGWSPATTPRAAPFAAGAAGRRACKVAGGSAL